MTNSTATKRPTKPRDDFPLFPGACGGWGKKIRGKVHYFGKVADDPKGERAIEIWLDQKDATIRSSRAPSDGRNFFWHLIHTLLPSCFAKLVAIGLLPTVHRSSEIVMSNEQR